MRQNGLPYDRHPWHSFKSCLSPWALPAMAKHVWEQEIGATVKEVQGKSQRRHKLLYVVVNRAK